ncbi:MAG TPA: hypothetical protein VHN80_21500, partial [Kineosporiaceae bacterium]|nr:hypothetical protein [Kineosporiaceae bacterium]
SWNSAGVASVLVGGLLALTASVPITAGVATSWADRSQRDGAGYLTSPTATLTTGTRALVSEAITVDAYGPNWAYPGSALGKARIRFTATDPNRSLFVGIAPTAVVGRYLSGTQYATVTDFDKNGATYQEHDGGTPPAPPADAGIWTVSTEGTGTQALNTVPAGSEVTLVVMNADGSPGVSVRADAGATAPVLGWVASGLLVAAAFLLIAGITLIVVPVRRSFHR